MFCRHDDEIIDKTVMPSGFEQASECVEHRSMRSSKMPYWLFQKKLVLTFKCRKCKRVTIHTETNP